MSGLTGKVYLVGAGPGDAKLITVKSIECIQKSDVLVYDRLASPRLLKCMKPGGEKIYVGKLPDRHTMKQEEINQLLVDLALQGKTVVRLKGGDPTIFTGWVKKRSCCAKMGSITKSYRASRQRSVYLPMRVYLLRTAIMPLPCRLSPGMKVRINWIIPFIGIK